MAAIDFQVGDTVRVVTRWDRIFDDGKVTRLLATQIVVTLDDGKEARFSRKHGRAVGGPYANDRSLRHRTTDPTLLARIAEIRAKAQAKLDEGDAGVREAEKALEAARDRRISLRSEAQDLRDDAETREETPPVREARSMGGE